MIVSIIDDVERFAALTPEWNELLRDSESDCPFLTAEWLQAWWTHLAGSRALHIITVRDAFGQLIAVAPLMAVKGPLGIFRRFEFLGTGNAGSDYLDAIVRIGYERDALQASLLQFSRDLQNLATKIDQAAQGNTNPAPPITSAPAPDGGPAS